MTYSTIAIKGNHLDKIVNIFEYFKYNDLDQDITFDNAEKFNEYLFDNYFEFANREIALRGIWFDNGWTIISDPEMVDIIDDEALLRLSKKLHTDVLTFIIQTTSGSFGFAKFNRTKERYFFSTDGEVSDNTGSPSSEEQGLNLNEKVVDNDILKLANNFGIDLEGKTCKSFIVKQLGYNEERRREIEQFEQAQTNQTTDTKKPWWKNMVERKTRANSTDHKLMVQWLNEVWCFVSSAILADNFVLRNRQLLAALKRYVP